MKQSYFQQAANIVSTLFHPMIVALCTFLLLGLFDPTGATGEEITIVGMSWVFAGLLPFLGVVFWVRLGRTPSVDIPRRTDRGWPLLWGILSYTVGTLVLDVVAAPPLFVGLMGCYAINTLLVYGITHYWKISIHTTGVAGPLVVLWYAIGSGVLPFVSIIVLVAIARVVLRKHSWAQVIMGAFLGLVATAVQLHWFWLRI